MLLPHSELPRDHDSSGRDLGDAEIARLVAAVRSGALNSTAGTFVTDFERAFAARMGLDHGVACNSGTAAVHTAVASLRPRAGDEIVTTGITDMGAIMPILYEGAAAVFCDVDPVTANVTAETIAPRLSERTRAIVVTHLFGRPCEMEPILALARERGVVVIEDCAQAPLAEDALGRVGSLGHIACFSFQQGKHLTTGEGGMVVTSDGRLAALARKFVNKGWGYGEAAPDHDFPALNYRMTELQGAVGLAQLDKLDAVVQRRRDSIAVLRAGLDGLRGVELPACPPPRLHSYWRVALDIDPAVVRGGTVALGPLLAAAGVPARPRYIGKPAWRTRVLTDWARHAVTRAAYEAAGRTPQPEDGTTPGTELVLDRMLVLPWNEFYTGEHVSSVVAALTSAVDALSARSESRADVG